MHFEYLHTERNNSPLFRILLFFRAVWKLSDIDRCANFVFSLFFYVRQTSFLYFYNFLFFLSLFLSSTFHLFIGFIFVSRSILYIGVGASFTLWLFCSLSLSLSCFAFVCLLFPFVFVDRIKLCVRWYRRTYKRTETDDKCEMYECIYVYGNTMRIEASILMCSMPLSFWLCYWPLLWDYMRTQCTVSRAVTRCRHPPLQYNRLIFFTRNELIARVAHDKSTSWHYFFVALQWFNLSFSLSHTHIGFGKGQSTDRQTNRPTERLVPMGMLC